MFVRSCTSPYMRIYEWYFNPCSPYVKLAWYSFYPVAHLAACGREMIVVSSGAVAAGRQVFRAQSDTRNIADPLPIPSRDSLKFTDANFPVESTHVTAQECAAAGQARLMALYDAMFQVYGFSAAQILLSIPDLVVSADSLDCNMLEIGA